ncbi:MAG: glycerate kinase type-2 family protein, partial [Candidatus Odinarchaeia archaeon]
MKIKNKETLIGNCINEENKKNRQQILEFLEIGLNAVDPRNIINRKITRKGAKINFSGETVDLDEVKNLYVIGAGKASGFLAVALEEILGENISKGVVAVLEGTASQFKTSHIEIIEGGHPLPNQKSVAAAKKILEIAENAEKDDLVLFLISGGGSALITYPPEGITLKEMKELNRRLIASGADIKEINTIRKHLSRIAGGILWSKAYPARGISLIISDVVGDDISSISSGPTSPDASTFNDALNILRKYKLEDKLPYSIIKRIKNGVKGIIKETPKPGDKIFNKIKNIIIGKNIDALNAIYSKAVDKGYNTIILSSMVEGEARSLGIFLSSIAKEIKKSNNPLKKPALILCGGETTVNLTKEGVGGRNQDVALSALTKMQSWRDTVLCCSSTDGIDGSSQAAGAIVDESTIIKADKLKLNPQEYLDEFNSNIFFKKVKDEIITGPTGTNVNDINLLL